MLGQSREMVSRLFRVALLACLLGVGPEPGSAADPASTDFVDGGANYESGRFTEAAAAYQREVHAGRYSANLFFNLGNTYYRLGDLGRAMANYQRALILEPGHAEAAANLAYVRGRTSARITPPEDLSAQTRAALSAVDVDRYAVLAAVSGWVAALGFCLGIFARRRSRTGWVLFGLALPFFAAFLGLAFWLGDGRKAPERAVVLKDQSPVRYAPADSAKVIVKLPVGEEVRVLSERGAWTYAQLADGARGWLPADGVERIIPPAALAQGSTK